MKPTKAEVAGQFGRVSHAYATSPGHAAGSDLQILLGLLDLEPDMQVLDVATGAGHTALAMAPGVQHVVAVDLTPEMIDEIRTLVAERNLTNVHARVMDAEALTFPDAGFDVVACRIAPHHFLDIVAALREIARVLRPGGQFGLEDSVSPDDPNLDSFINEVENLRDPTHVRSYTEPEWRSMLEAVGFEITSLRLYRKSHEINAWIQRSGIDDDAIERVYHAFAAASPAAREHYDIQYEDSRATRFTDDKVILRADKRLKSDEGYPVSQ